MPLSHAALTVRDRERSAAFYGEHLGLRERVHEDEHLLILGSPDGSLLALSEGVPPGRTTAASSASKSPTRTDTGSNCSPTDG